MYNLVVRGTFSESPVGAVPRKPDHLEGQRIELGLAQSKRVGLRIGSPDRQSYIELETSFSRPTLWMSTSPSKCRL